MQSGLWFSAPFPSFFLSVFFFLHLAFSRLSFFSHSHNDPILLLSYPLPSSSSYPNSSTSLSVSVSVSLRQNLREKHARHVADLKAYYESEIQSLRDKLGLAQLPPDLEKSNRALELRSHHLIPS